MPLMVQSFPAHYAGRVSTSSNLVVFSVIFAGQWAIGKVVDLWPKTATGYASDGYTWAFGILFILQLARSGVAGAVASTADGAFQTRIGGLGQSCNCTDLTKGLRSPIRHSMVPC